MDLLDIAEPGQSPAPHDPRRRLVVGIDLGTTYSLVAAIATSGKPACIPDPQGRAALPSVVHYGATPPPLVGWEAHELAVTHPTTTISSVKRFMGRGVADLAGVADRIPYQIAAGPGGMVRIAVAEEQWVSPVEVSAAILNELRQRAEAELGGKLFGAVITVPAYFDDAQRQATKDAGKLAGLEVLRLVNEPTAAALAYGLDNGAEGVYAIYDLGGGTFDISVLKLSGGVFQVLATGGNSALGGDDFDHRLAGMIFAELGLTTPDAGQIKAVLRASRDAKEQLTTRERVTLRLELAGLPPYHRELEREEFERLIAELVRSTLAPCRRALKDAGVRTEELQGVVLVGGSTRVPLVRRSVAEWFGREPLCDLDPDQVVALGAAHQADLLGGNSTGELLLLDVLSLSLGVEMMGGLVEKIIPRNTAIPVARAQEFTTFKDGQGAMAIHVLQGERELAAECRSLARFELRGIPPLVAGAARITVTYQVDADGLLTVAAREETTGVEQKVEVKPSYGLTDAEVERMLRDALVNSAADVKFRWLTEARVEAERVLAAAGAALREDGALLNDAELRQVKRAMLRLWEATRGEDHELINLEITRLDQETTFFAQRRMDRGINQALTGRRLEEFE